MMTGPPESNSAASIIFSSTILVSGSACPTMARSKRRAMAELIARADHACADRQRLSLNTGARACRCETFLSRFDRSFVMPFKHFQFWRNVAGARNRNGRTVKKDDPCQVGV